VRTFRLLTATFASVPTGRSPRGIGVTAGVGVGDAVEATVGSGVVVAAPDADVSAVGVDETLLPLDVPHPTASSASRLSAATVARPGPVAITPPR